MSGRSPLRGSGLRPFGAEPQDASQAKPLVPNAWPFMGYAPGGYMGKCRVCGEEHYDLDKRAHQCLECAVREAKAALDHLQNRELELLRKVETYGNLLCYLASDSHDVKPDAVRSLARDALASADTHPKDGDVKQAPLVGGAVGEAETPNA